MGGFGAVYSSPIDRLQSLAVAECLAPGVLTAKEMGSVIRYRTRELVQKSVEDHLEKIEMRWDRMESLRPGGFKLEEATDYEKKYWEFVRELAEFTRGPSSSMPKPGPGKPSGKSKTERKHLFETWLILAFGRHVPSIRELVKKALKDDHWEYRYNHFIGWLNREPSARIDRHWIELILASLSAKVSDATWSALENADVVNPADAEEGKRISARMCAMDRIVTRHHIQLIGAKVFMWQFFKKNPRLIDAEKFSLGFPHPEIHGEDWISVAKKIGHEIGHAGIFLAGLENIERVLSDPITPSVVGGGLTYWEPCLNAMPVDFSRWRAKPDNDPSFNPTKSENAQ